LRNNNPLKTFLKVVEMENTKTLGSDITDPNSQNIHEISEKTSPRPCEICKKVKFLKEFRDSSRTLKVDLCGICLQRKAK
jgi:hypothetical protein